MNDFDLKDFVPYLLNQAAEATSLGFQTYYKSQYGMLRTEWRVVFHLGRYGDMTAKEICEAARIHKTKVSRAVQALEQKRFLRRTEQEQDRRHETLSLTQKGQTVFTDLIREAQKYDRALLAGLTDTEVNQLRSILRKLSAIQ